MAVKKFNMEELCVSFISRNRFYAVLLSKMNKIAAPAPHVKTAAVGFSEKGKIVLYYNEDYFLDLHLAAAQSVIEHEVLHVFFKHLFRLPMSEDPKDKENNHIQNLACDMAINQYLKDLPDGAVYPKTHNLPEEMSAEWYFAELKKQQKDGKDFGGDSTIDDHGGWGGGKPQDPNDPNGDSKDGDTVWAGDKSDLDIEGETDNIVRKAIAECDDKSIGELPAAIQREIAAMKNPEKRHDWKRELKIFINTVLTVAKKMSQKRVNKRFMDMDYLLPGKKKSRRPKLLLARDTSGSVFNDECQAEFLKEMVAISKFCDVLVCDCDTKVHQIYTVKKVEDFRKYQGGGGTAFEPVFIAAKEKGVDGVIYLTDTEGSFPQKEKIGKFASKTIWVTINQKTVKVPFGKHVNIDQKE